VDPAFTSETSINLYQATSRYIIEDGTVTNNSHLEYVEFLEKLGFLEFYKFFPSLCIITNIGNVTSVLKNCSISAPFSYFLTIRNYHVCVCIYYNSSDTIYFLVPPEGNR
jgi:hypothetical protein